MPQSQKHHLHVVTPPKLLVDSLARSRAQGQNGLYAMYRRSATIAGSRLLCPCRTEQAPGGTTGRYRLERKGDDGH
jgi:hypothetical protein